MSVKYMKILLNLQLNMRFMRLPLEKPVHVSSKLVPIHLFIGIPYMFFLIWHYSYIFPDFPGSRQSSQFFFRLFLEANCKHQNCQVWPHWMRCTGKNPRHGTPRGCFESEKRNSRIRKKQGDRWFRFQRTRWLEGQKSPLSREGKRIRIRKGIPLIAGKSRLVKYYNLPRWLFRP